MIEWVLLLDLLTCMTCVTAALDLYVALLLWCNLIMIACMFAWSYGKFNLISWSLAVFQLCHTCNACSNSLSSAPIQRCLCAMCANQALYTLMHTPLHHVRLNGLHHDTLVPACNVWHVQCTCPKSSCTSANHQILLLMWECGSIQQCLCAMRVHHVCVCVCVCVCAMQLHSPEVLVQFSSFMSKLHQCLKALELLCMCCIWDMSSLHQQGITNVKVHPYSDCVQSVLTKPCIHPWLDVRSQTMLMFILMSLFNLACHHM